MTAGTPSYEKANCCAFGLLGKGARRGHRTHPGFVFDPPPPTPHSYVSPLSHSWSRGAALPPPRVVFSGMQIHGAVTPTRECRHACVFEQSLNASRNIPRFLLENSAQPEESNSRAPSPTPRPLLRRRYLRWSWASMNDMWESSFKLFLAFQTPRPRRGETMPPRRKLGIGSNRSR